MTLLKRLFLTFVIYIPLYAYAATEATISISPTSPAPYQTVVVSLSSNLFDPNTAMITWKSNGKTLLSGVGAKRVSVILGGGGTEVPISYNAVAADGTSASGNIIISPQSVELLYETPESYVPAFYEGRSLPGEGAVVKVSVIPSINEGVARVPAGSLSYLWYINGEYSDVASGVGKSQARIALDYLSNETDVRVVVRSPRGNTAEKTISIPPHAVMPLLYEYDDLFGVNFNRTFFRRIEITDEITLSLEPYYLSTNNTFSSAPTYNWYLDGLPITPQEKTLISFRPQANSVGTRALTIMIENAKRKLQKAQTDLEILYDTRK